MGTRPHFVIGAAYTEARQHAYRDIHFHHTHTQHKQRGMHIETYPSNTHINCQKHTHTRTHTLSLPLSPSLSYTHSHIQSYTHTCLHICPYTVAPYSNAARCI